MSKNLSMVTNEWQHWTNQRITNFINGSNMKNKFFLYAAVLGLAISSTATADEGFYAGLIGGANWISRSNSHHFRGDNNAGYLVGFDVGYTWCNNFSGEFEFVYRHNELNRCHKKGCDKDFDKNHPVGLNAESACSVSSSSSHCSSSPSSSTHCSSSSSHRRSSSSSDCSSSSSSSSDCSSSSSSDCSSTFLTSKGRAEKSSRAKRRNHHGHGKVEGYSVMFNGRYDVPIDMCFTPYVKGGIGWARTKIHASHHEKAKNCGNQHDAYKAHYDFNHSKHKSGFAWQVGAGVSFPVCDNTLLDVGYNFLRAQKEINNNSFVAALRYQF